MGNIMNEKELQAYRSKTVLVYEGTLVDASGNSQATPIDVRRFKEATFFIKSTAHAGTSPTLDVLVRSISPQGDLHTLATFAQHTDEATEMKAVAANLGENVCISWTIGGSATPKWSFTVWAVCKI